MPFAARRKLKENPSKPVFVCEHETEWCNRYYTRPNKDEALEEAETCMRKGIANCQDKRKYNAVLQSLNSGNITKALGCWNRIDSKDTIRVAEYKAA